MREYDVVVLGAGPAGEAVATELAGSGLSLAVVEAALVGGECPYWGCIPSKTLLRNAEVLREAGRARELAASRVEYDPDFALSARRVRWMARDLDDAGAARALTAGGGELLRGTARITGPDLLEVDGTPVRARRAVVVCTGTRPAVPQIPGLETVDAWTNREAVLAAELPGALAVVGGGAVGVELAQAFARFGSRVTLIQAVDRLVPAEEPEAGNLLRRHLEAEGITVVAPARITRVEAGRVVLEAGEVAFDRLLLATGRIPNLDGHDLDAAGVRTTARGWLEVDPATLLTASPLIYGAGDVTGIAGFTHVAHYHGTLIGRAIARGGAVAAVHDAIPRVTFTDPEVAGVGLTEAQARASGLDVRVAVADASETARGYAHGFSGGGLVKVVAGTETRRLVGATIVSPRAGEMIGELVLAMRAGVPVDVLAGVVHAFPTFSRVLQGVFDDLAGQLGPA